MILHIILFLNSIFIVIFKLTRLLAERYLIHLKDQKQLAIFKEETNFYFFHLINEKKNTKIIAFYR